MAYSVTKQNDGDLSLGNLRGELVNLIPASSDYAIGGYLMEGIGGNPLTSGNVGMDKILGVIPCGDNDATSAYFLKWNTSTQKLQVFQDSTNGNPMSEVPANTDLSAFSFQLLLIGL